MSDDNPLGLGAFIIMEFIEGVSLGKILEEHPEPEHGPILRSDIDDKDLETIYRQVYFCNFQSTTFLRLDRCQK